MKISDLIIGDIYLIDIHGEPHDYLVLAKTDDNDYVKLLDMITNEIRWYSQGELSAAKVIAKVTGTEVVFEAYKNMNKIFNKVMPHGWDE